MSALAQFKQFNQVALAVFLVCLLGGLAVARFTNSPIAWLAGALLGIYFLFAIKIIDQWEKVAVLRFGRYRALRGPGLVVIIPILDTLSRYVDQRVRVSTVSAESTLTRDTVPVNVDAIFFWLVLVVVVVVVEEVCENTPVEMVIATNNSIKFFMIFGFKVFKNDL